eukprot:PhM_4_TR17599/c0_g2_i1/m.65181/K15979/SND1; staphylococcal nuclease domain-containing protein 1
MSLDSKTGSGVFVVYAVDSGDRLTLAVPNSFPPVLKHVILTGIMCPKPARLGPNQEMIPDEPFAYDAREFVRKQVIGKQVKFNADGMIEALQREVGRVNLQGGDDLGYGLVTRGFADVNERQGKGPQDYMIKMIMANEDAMNSKLGKYAHDASIQVRDLKPSPPEDPEALLSVLKAEPCKVIVERVMSGSSMLVTLSSMNQQLALHLAGVTCPSVKGATPEPFANEAKLHTERCLLHREVNVEFESVGSFGQFIGSVVAGKKVFQEDLLNRGFAKVMPTSVANSPHREVLRACEKAAQDRKVGIWKDYVPPQIMAPEVKPDKPQWSGEKEFSAEVVQIVSGDTFFVLHGSEMVKITLANVRAPRDIQRKQEKEANRVVYDNYSWEAKEELRQMAIGKEVMVSIDYVRVIEETKELRPYATVVLPSGQNLGAHLLGKGLARGAFFKDELAVCADLLRDAEAMAREKKLGIHSDKAPAPVRVVELSRPTEKKARQFLAYFQRGGHGGRAPRIPATVEMVLGAASIRTYIPKENTVITLKIAGIIAPSAALNDQPADMFAGESKTFAMRHLQNRDVEVEVETVDKFGNFIGAMYVQHQNYAIQIVKAGLAVVNNIDRLSYGSELHAAEKKAQEARLCLWSEAGHLPARYIQAQERANRIAPGTMMVAREELAPIMVTEVISSTNFFVCALDDETKAKRKTVEKALDEYADSGEQYHPKKDELVIVRFSQDGRWYRGRAIAQSSNKKLTTIRYIDFGNQEERCDDDIRVCSSALFRDTAPLATEVNMAFLRHMPSDYVEDAADALRTYLEMPALYGRQEYVVGQRKYYTITSNVDGGETAAQYLMRVGLAILDPRVESFEQPDVRAIVRQLSTAQAAVQKSGKNVWQYGTAVAEEDDADF